MKTYTIRKILFLIVLSLVVPACLIAIGFSLKAYYDGRDSVTSSTLTTARAMMLVVDGELGALRSTAQTLTHSRFLTDGDLAGFHRQAQEVLPNTSGFTFVLSDRSGQQLLNTLKPYGSVLPRHGNDAQLARVFASGKPAISDLFWGGVTRKEVLSVSTPVIRDGKVLYALDIGIWPAIFSRILVAQNIPNDWVVAIFDSRGTIVARNKAADKFIGKKGAPELLRNMAIKPEGIIEVTTLDGIRVFSMYSRSAATGWSVAIGVPTASITAGLWRSLWLTSGGVLVLLFTGILVARYAGARITDAIRALGPQAAALGRGEILPTPALALKEAADLGIELRNATDILRQTQYNRGLAEHALRESEQRNAAIFATTPLAIALTKWPEDTTVSVNDAFARLFGYSKEEVVGKTSLNLRIVDIDARARIAAALQQHGSVRNFECAYHAKSGAVIDLSINVDNVAIDGVTFSLTTIQDVSEVRAAQAERGRLAAIVDSANDGIIGKTLDGVVYSWNHAAELMFGYTAAEAIGQTVLSLIVPSEAAAEEADILAKIAAGANISHFTTVRRRKNGELIHVSIAVSPIRNAQGAIVGAAKTIRDMSVEAEIKKKLLESERRLSVALDERTLERDTLEQRVIDRTRELASTLDFNKAILLHSPLPMGVYAASGQCALVNDAYASLVGATREALLAQNYNDIVAWQESGLLEDCRTAIEQERLHRREVHVLSSFGKELWVECNLVPTFLNDEKHLLIQFFDLSERKRAEEQLRIVATAFDAQEAMMITDAKTVILRVNRAFSESTGYSSADVVGLTPHVLNSDRHDTSFFAAIWECIDRDGSWHGEIWDQRKNGEIFPNWLTITAVKNDDGVVTNYVSTQTDITTRKKAEEEIRLLAFFDTLTNLPNRRLLMDRLRQALATSSRSGRLGALMFIDLDNFKTLNDTLGHDQGDSLLRQVAERLPLCVRGGDTVARLGGDEFVVMLEELSEDSEQAATQAGTVGNQILEALNQPYILDGQEYRSTPSIGITLFSKRQNDIEELFKRADLAMYQAKAAGRNALRFFEPHMQAAVTAHVEMEAELRKALYKEEFILHYQAQVNREGQVTGAEALVRWNHPLHGLVPPGEFIPRAEESGLILPLGSWVLETACIQLARWACQPDTAALTMAVNVSSRQFRRPDFVQQLLDVLARTGADPHRLKLEITESLLLDDTEDIINKMKALQEHGVGFSLDDFGTGYSSLAYLKLLPLDQLKIDRSFVRDVLNDSNDAAIARTILALGHTLGLAVIAEGVETDAQRTFLAENGCNAYQGFLFSRPVPMKEFEILLEQIKIQPSVDSASVLQCHFPPAPLWD
ncbi:EAL domain-containing protein [Massilia antarctica]|uniref:EAL domain-containing protein n=1 Tax=Massilia antarctica TaxID=2765360 RepID=A0AA49A7M3_9BURK|nr:EAL domain-containing protein [Massilia antarctica]QPI48740.1 EAL domain-containing protein [Massilia antarctica]